MTMVTDLKLHQPWGIRSTSYWITIILAMGIIFIGARFMLQPQVGAIGYGIGFNDEYDTVYGKIKGIRDIFSGIVLIPLLVMRMRKAIAWVLTIAIIIPVTDFLTILFTNGLEDLEHLLIHGVTALVMIVNSFLLFSKPTQSVKA